jgi:hypothetical protein
MIDGTVHIVLVCYKHFTKVILLACLPKDFSLEETNRGIIPTCATAVLVFNGGDGEFKNWSERPTPALPVREGGRLRIEG